MRWKRLTSAKGKQDVTIESRCKAKYLTGKLPSWETHCRRQARNAVILMNAEWTGD